MFKKTKITSMKLLAELMEKPLSEGKTVKFTVVGNSMYPLLRNGEDCVCLSKLPSPKKYDVILYKRKDGSFVLHRIVGVLKDGFVLLGDNQLVKEYPVAFCDVVAVMTGFWRKGAYVSVNKAWYRAYSALWGRFVSLRKPVFAAALRVRKLFRH